MPVQFEDYDSVRGLGSSPGLPYAGPGLANAAIEKYVTIDIGGGGGTITLTLDQCLASEIVITNGGLDTSVEWPTAFPGHVFAVYNNSSGGGAITFLVTGQTGVTVGDGTRALLVCEATDIARVTPDT